MRPSEKAAREFFERLKSGKIKKNILPNTAADYTSTKEEIDLDRYKFFLNSFAYDDLRNSKVRSYYGD